MNKIKRPFGIFALISMLSAIIGGVLIFSAFYSDYDLTIHHFENSSALAIAAGCAIALGVVISASAAVLLSKKVCLPAAKDASAVSVFLSVFAGWLIIGSEAVDMIFSEESLSAFSVVIGVLAVLSGIYMMFSLLPSTAITLLSMAPVLWLGFSLIGTYRATDTALNDPFNTYYALELISLMLFFTFSAGVALRPVSRKGFYVFSSYLLLSVGGAVMLSRLILSLVQKSAFDVSVLSSIMYLTLYLWAASRVFSLDRSQKACCNVAEDETQIADSFADTDENAGAASDTDADTSGTSDGTDSEL